MKDDRKGIISSKKIKQLLKFPKGSVVWMWHQVYVPVAWKQNGLVFFWDAVLSVTQLIQFNNKFMLDFIRMSIDVSNHYVLFLCSFDLYKQRPHTITKKCKVIARSVHVVVMWVNCFTCEKLLTMISHQTGKFQIFTFIPRRLSSWAKQNNIFVAGAGFWGKGRNVMDARPHEGRKED